MPRFRIGSGLLCALAAGCGHADDGTDASRYLPGWPEARSALTKALTDWREASPPFPVSRQLDGVLFADKQRKPGDRLRAFAILGESEVENARQFTVRLDLEGQDGPRLVRYNVLGRDPVWVFRLEDYEMISHWEHPMNDEPSPAPDPRPTLGDERAGPRRIEEESAVPSVIRPDSSAGSASAAAQRRP